MAYQRGKKTLLSLTLVWHGEELLQISTHFTATPGILPPSTRLKLASIRCSSQVEPGDFTSVLHHRLRTLYAQ